MTSLRVPTQYKDDLYYPILIPMGGGNKIVEMQGKQINRAVNDSTDFDQFIEICVRYDIQPAKLMYAKLLEYPQTTLDAFIHQHRDGWNGKVGKIAQTLSRILHQLD